MEQERTLVLIKPDGVKRALMGRILSRLEDAGLKIIGCKLIQADKELAKKHYADHFGKDFYPQLENFITSGPVLAIVIEGFDVIMKVRNLAGVTIPFDAAAGTIRGDFAHLTKERGDEKETGVANLLHASDEKPGNAEKEIKLWFKPEELYDYKRCDEEFTM